MVENVYHYTSYQALLGIINNNELVFHGSRYDCMNDPNDCKFAREIVLPPILKSIENDPRFTPKEKDFIEAYPYVVSFSEKEDDESMWNHYGSQVCLSLSANDIKDGCDIDGKHIATWGKCHYVDEAEIPSTFRNIFKDMEQSDNIADNVMEACSFIKRKAFEREKEWRLVSNDYYSFDFNSKGYIEDKEIPNDDTHFKANSIGMILPFKRFSIKASALKKIIINEDNLSDYLRIKQHIKILLTKYKFRTDIDIKQTNKYPL